MLKQLWPYLWHEWRWFLLAAATTSLLIGIEVCAPILIGIFVDALLRPSAADNFWAQAGIIVLLVTGAVLRGYLMAQQLAFVGEIGERVAARLRNALWGHVQNLPLDYIERRGPGRLSLRFISDTRSVQRFVT